MTACWILCSLEDASPGASLLKKFTLRLPCGEFRWSRLTRCFPAKVAQTAATTTKIALVCMMTPPPPTSPPHGEDLHHVHLNCQMVPSIPCPVQ